MSADVDEESGTAGNEAGARPVVAVYATFPDAETAEAVGAAVVTAGLAACVNIMPGAVSIFRWEGRLERTQEAIAIFKTREASIARLTDEIRRLHPYDTPAIVALPIAGGNAAYLKWVWDETGEAAR